MGQWWGHGILLGLKKKQIQVSITIKKKGKEFQNNSHRICFGSKSKRDRRSMSFFVKRKKGSLDAPSQSLAHTSPPLKTKKNLARTSNWLKKCSLDAPSQNLARTSNSYRKVCLHESRSGRCSPVSSGVPRGLRSLRPIHCWSFVSSIRGGVLPTQLLWILTCDKRDGLIGVSLPLELEQQFSLNCTAGHCRLLFLNSRKLSVGGRRHPWL